MPVFFLRSSRPVGQARSKIGHRFRMKVATALLSKENATYSEDNRMEEVLNALPSQVFVLLAPRCLEEYVSLDYVIGKGGFATVYCGIATDKGLKTIAALEDGVTYAVRRADEPGNLSAVAKSLTHVSPAREIEFLQAMVHPGACHGLVRIVAFFVELPAQRLSLVMEHLHGSDLYDYLSTRSSALCEKDAASLLRQAAIALHYLHRIAGALHRDVKPENFGFAQQVLPKEPLPILKLFDFDSCWVLPSPVTEEDALAVQPLPLAGTPLYMAPEVWAGIAGPPSDMWSVGVLLYVMLTLELPFGMNKRKNYRKATREPLDFGAPIFARVSTGARHFVSALLEKRPEARPTSSVALSAQWLLQDSVLQPDICFVD